MLHLMKYELTQNPKTLGFHPKVAGMISGTLSWVTQGLGLTENGVPTHEKQSKLMINIVLNQTRLDINKNKK